MLGENLFPEEISMSSRVLKTFGDEVSNIVIIFYLFNLVAMKHSFSVYF